MTATAPAPSAARTSLPLPWRVALAWVVLYPLPPLPFAPLFGYLTAIALGEPFTDGYDEHGWPRLGPITPGFVAITLGLPWVVTSAIAVSVAALVVGQGPRRSAGRPAQ